LHQATVVVVITVVASIIISAKDETERKNVAEERKHKK